MELWPFPWKPCGPSLIMLTYQNACCSSLSTKTTKSLSQYSGKRLYEAAFLASSKENKWALWSSIQSSLVHHAALLIGWDYKPPNSRQFSIIGNCGSNTFGCCHIRESWCILSLQSLGPDQNPLKQKQNSYLLDLYLVFPSGVQGSISSILSSHIFCVKMSH